MIWLRKLMSLFKIYCRLELSTGAQLDSSGLAHQSFPIVAGNIEVVIPDGAGDWAWDSDNSK